MIVNATKIFQKMKNKSLLSIGKDIIQRKNSLYYNYKKVLQFRKFGSFIMHAHCAYSTSNPFYLTLFRSPFNMKFHFCLSATLFSFFDKGFFCPCFCWLFWFEFWFFLFGFNVSFVNFRFLFLVQLQISFVR